jgi:hypothetical protein
MHDRDAYPPAEESLGHLQRSGWSTGETAWHGAGGGIVYRVDGNNGENKLLVRRTTAREVWWRAIEAAAAVGMLADWPRPSGKAGEGQVSAGGRFAPED